MKFYFILWVSKLLAKLFKFLCNYKPHFENNRKIQVIKF